MTIRSRCQPAFLALVLLSGCDTSQTGLLPDGHQLTRDAKQLRRANAEPLDLPRELVKAPAPPYTVEPGDILLVQPADFDSPIRIPGDQPVLPDGSIHLGKFGRVYVAGMDVAQIEAVVRELVGKQVKDAGPITVRLISRQSKVFYVLGEVNAPGSYPLAGRETALDAILAAGGVNTRADTRRVILSRPTGPDDCRVALPIHYDDIVQIGDTATNYQMRAGDRIFVPTKCFLDDLMHHVGKKQDAGCKSHVPCGCGETDADGACSSWLPAQRAE